MKIAAYLLAGIGLGFAVAYWQGGDEPSAAWDSDFAFDDGTALDRRLSELENSLALERLERRALADELAALQASLADGPEIVEDDADLNPRARIAALVESGDEDNPMLDRLRERFPDGLPGQGGFDEAAREQRQIERFVDAGLTVDRAQWILQREDEIAMEVLQARYEATQNNASPEEIADLNSTALLRAELGDADYEKYLAGSGRPTTINVREVLTNSPAQAAGLEPGDQIVSYGGKRVFDMNELTGLTYEGTQGSAVPINVIRDGQEIQLYVESGPIGVSGGGRSTRRRR